MYSLLLFFHSLNRWLVLTSLLYAIYRGYYGWLGNRSFSKLDNAIRHITATIAHVQLIFGLWLYFVSPVIGYFLSNYKVAVHNRDIRFFGMEHSSLMFVAIILITIGSVKAKRKMTDKQKFSTMAIWYTIALFIIMIAIPWPFSPFSANRAYFRWF